MNANQKGMVVALVAVVVVVLAGGGLYLFENKKAPTPRVPAQQTGSPSAAVTAQPNPSNSTSSGALVTYSNSQYAFSLKSPEGTHVDASVGNQIDIPAKSGRIAVFKPTATKGSLTIEVEPSANCTDTSSGANPAHETINGTDFTVYDLDRVLSSGSSSVTAREYCTVKNTIEYKLITQLPYSGTPLQVDQDPVLSQMVASFTFTP